MSNNIYKIVSLYSFFSFQENSIIELKENLFSIEKNNDLSGLLIIAREGLNGTLCAEAVSYTHLTLPTKARCRTRRSPDH